MGATRPPAATLPFFGIGFILRSTFLLSVGSCSAGPGMTERVAAATDATDKSIGTFSSSSLILGLPTLDPDPGAGAGNDLDGLTDRTLNPDR